MNVISGLILDISDLRGSDIGYAIRTDPVLNIGSNIEADIEAGIRSDFQSNIDNIRSDI